MERRRECGRLLGDLGRMTHPAPDCRHPGFTKDRQSHPCRRMGDCERALDLSTEVGGETTTAGGDESVRREIRHRAVIVGERQSEIEISLPLVRGASLSTEVRMVQGEDLGPVESEPSSQSVDQARNTAGLTDHDASAADTQPFCAKENTCVAVDLADVFIDSSKASGSISLRMVFRAIKDSCRILCQWLSARSTMIGTSMGNVLLL